MLERDPSVEIEKQDPTYYITVVGPNGVTDGKGKGQRVVPVDQPGLPDDEGEPKTPSIGTKAKFAEGSTQVVSGAKVEDTVTYEGLVPGKEYTLNAELISKEDGKTVLGKGEETFTPESANGEVVVTITVDKSVTEPVEAAVAFEELTSVEVDKDGKETPDNNSDNPIAEHKDINDGGQTVNSVDEPSKSDEPSDEPSKSDEPSDEPSKSGEPSDEPSDEPSKSDEPSDEPSKSDEPSDEPSKSDEPSDEPSKSDEPSDEPSKSDEPSDEPSKSDEPSDEPSKSDEPSDEPSKSDEPS
ncbi:VaFE repeat-containing surface-anchored protein, partial [Corynebacterium sp. MSK004]|uniref:VaFE repeat-containing surface-anchored protein n=1 Tax=Corynebacterium sp. MSK004 TaxID=3050186 RepID=UPI00254AC339